MRGGVARFDDVLVQPREPLASASEGTLLPDVPSTLGPQDSLSWANPAGLECVHSARPCSGTRGCSCREVTVTLRVEPAKSPRRAMILAASPGAPEAQWLSVAVATSPEGAEATLHITGADGRAIERRVELGEGGLLQLARKEDKATVRWGGASIAELPGTGALSHVGLEVDGPPVCVSDLTVFGPEVRDYVFGVAPTDWWVSAGTWEVAPRWACDRRWSWYAGWGGDLAIWNKRPVQEMWPWSTTWG